MSDLVGNPEDRFFHVAAHMVQLCVFEGKAVIGLPLTKTDEGGH